MIESCRCSHKTVFVLDHTPYFTISSDTHIHFDNNKLRPNIPQQTPISSSSSSLLNNAPLPPVSKSLWTCSVEAAVEYCRIVWDLFPNTKLVEFIVSDIEPHILNTWCPKQQNLQHILNAMSLMGVPGSGHMVGASNPPSVVPGLKRAVETLAEPSEQQQARLRKEQNPLNRCRIVCITSARDDTSMKSLVDIVQTDLLKQNKNLHQQMLRIHHCHLVIINVFPVNVQSQVSNRPLREVCSSLSVEIHSVSADRLAQRMLRLLLPHYNLASTTVTGIPMKEEQNASSSANYDVEILHPAAAHSEISRMSPSELSGEKSDQENEAAYETVTLRWCTPRGNWGDWGACGPIHRVTPVDVASRPSACLVNFLLNGRSVMLEMPRKGGLKVMSHVLAAHGGEIFIHNLGAGRSAFEDPPSVSEGPGGRVTDYRIKDFGELMQQNRLGPERGSNSLTKSRAKLARHTFVWPLTLSSTMLFNLGSCLDPLPKILLKDILSDDDILKCKQVIYSLMSLETHQEPFAFVALAHRKGNRREEQWRQVWSELEILIRGHQTSPGHRAVLKCLRECRAGDSSVERASVIRATTDSPMSPPPSGMSLPQPPIQSSSSSSSHPSIYNAHRSVLDMILSNESNRGNSRKTDFAGRLANPNGIAVLYPHLKASSGGEKMSVETEN